MGDIKNAKMPFSHQITNCMQPPKMVGLETCRCMVPKSKRTAKYAIDFWPILGEKLSLLHLMRSHGVEASGLNRPKITLSQSLAVSCSIGHIAGWA